MTATWYEYGAKIAAHQMQRLADCLWGPTPIYDQLKAKLADRNQGGGR